MSDNDCGCASVNSDYARTFSSVDFSVPVFFVPIDDAPLKEKKQNRKKINTMSTLMSYVFVTKDIKSFLSIFHK